MVILGIETSCDETACAILDAGPNGVSVMANIISSQIKLHAAWGGVVPNLAAREHLINIIPVIKQCLKEARLSPRGIDLLSVTNGPGLIPALLVGTTTAKTLAYLWKKPLVGIHHIEGHIYANLLGPDKSIKKSSFEFPALALIVSGGHTQLILMKSHLHYEIVGETLDDAAGEAFDKVARILGLGYPGGPAIAKLAQKAPADDKYKRLKKKLPRPMLNANNLNFSFSGLKTAVLYLARDNEQLLKDEIFKQELCREFQQAVIDVLVKKTLKAARKFSPKTIMLAGGVSANTQLRAQLGEMVKNKLAGVAYLVPQTSYSVDNATMIAMAAYWRYSLTKDKNFFDNKWSDLKTSANLKINEHA